MGYKRTGFKANVRMGYNAAKRKPAYLSGGGHFSGTTGKGTAISYQEHLYRREMAARGRESWGMAGVIRMLLQWPLMFMMLVLYAGTDDFPLRTVALWSLVLVTVLSSARLSQRLIGFRPTLAIVSYANSALLLLLLTVATGDPGIAVPAIFYLLVTHLLAAWILRKERRMAESWNYFATGGYVPTMYR